MNSQPSSLNLSTVQSWDPLAYERLYLGWCIANLREPFLPDVLALVDESWFSSTNTANLYSATVEVALTARRGVGLTATPARVLSAAQRLSGESSGWAEREIEACRAAESQVMFDLPALRMACVDQWRIVRCKPVVQRAITRAGALLDNTRPSDELPHQVDALLRDAATVWSDGLHGIDRDAQLTPSAFIREALTPLDDTRPLTLPTKLRAFDLLVGGGVSLADNPCAGRLIVVAARPAVGKTAFVANLAHGVAARGGHVAMYSLEVPSRQIFSRLAAVHDYANQPGLKLHELITPAQFSSRSFTPAQRQRLNSYEHSLGRGITIRDDVLGLEQIVSHIRLAKRRNDSLVMAAVDHLGLIGLPKADTNAIAVGMATRALKLLAVELRIDVVLLCQLNREVERRNGAKPVLSDLRDSGRIEEDADVVLSLHRQLDGDHPQELTVSALKNRHGAIGSLHCDFHLANGVIANRLGL